MKPTGIIIHHSLTKDGKVEDWAGIKRYHMSYRFKGEVITESEYNKLTTAGKTAGLEKPWSDIGYHFGVERVNGVLTLLTGRSPNTYGAHCTGHNDMLGICCVGNFDVIPPDNSMLLYLAMATAGILRVQGLPVSSVHPHHEYAAKSCPGVAFPWFQFIEYVEAAL